MLDSAPPMPPSVKTGRSALFTTPEAGGDIGAMGGDPMVQTMMATKQIETGLQSLVKIYPDAVSLIAPLQSQIREIVMALMSQSSSPAALSGAAPMMPPMAQPGAPGGPGTGMGAGQQMGAGL